MKIYPLRERVLGNVVADKAALHEDRPFIFFEDQVISYRELDTLSNRLANSLAALGVRKAMHVAFLVDNKPEIILLYVALAKLGAVCVPLNTAGKGELLAYYLEQSDSELLIVDAHLLGRLDAIRDRVPKLGRLISISEPEATPADQGGLRWPVTPYMDLLGADDRHPDVEVRFSDLYSLIYTSGTTGPSKGNMSTHSHTLGCGFELAKSYGYRADDRLYVCLPLFHGNAWICSVMPALVADGSVVIARRFSASTFWDDIRRYGVTQFNSLGAMTNFLWARAPEPADREHKVRQVMVVPTPTQYFRAFEERFGVKFTSLYALSDCGVVTVLGPDAPEEKRESAGRPCENVEVRIVDDDDLEVPRGEPGEIVVRTQTPWHFCQGYYSMPEATVSTVRNLWFHTGDRGYMDAQGYLYFVDRKKDAIRRRGENISSFEVEQVILKHPAVVEAAAYPVRSEHSEDEVMASVVVRPGARLAEADLIAHCLDNMAYFMVPRYVEVLQELPKTMTEKVEKYKLKAAAERRLDEVWDREKAGIVVKR